MPDFVHLGARLVLSLSLSLTLPLQTPKSPKVNKLRLLRYSTWTGIMLYHDFPTSREPLAQPH